MSKNLQLDSKEIRDRLIEAIDQALMQGQWDVSPVFRNIRKRLLALRALIQTELTVVQSVTGDDQSHDGLLQAEGVWSQKGYEIIYLALYQMQGHKIELWVNALANLKEYCVTRPAYKQESHVRELVDSKRSRNEAYVKVWVKTEDITSAVAVDRFGHEVVTIREGSARPEHIIEFVHDHERYSFRENQLVLKKS